ncbi:MAG: hypothetical protein WCI93_01110 [bacterium]
MKKHIVVILLIVFIMPSVAFASWWNPFTWKVFSFNNKKEAPVETQKIVETKKIEDKIIEKKNSTNDLNNKNNQLQSVPVKEVTSTTKDKTVDNIINWRTYTNTTYNYQFKYPQTDYYSEKDNTVILESRNPGNVILKSKTGYVSDSIFSVEIVPDITNAEQLKTLLYSKLFTTDVKVNNVNIGGIDGIELTNDYLINIAGFIKNKQAYIFKSYNEFKLEPYKNLLSSFKFVEPTKVTETKIIKDSFNGVDCGRGKDNGVGMPQPEVDCFFTKFITCSNAKIILGKESGYASDILISVNKVNDSCIIKAETNERIVSCQNKITKTAQELKEKLESEKTTSQQDKFLTVTGIPIILSDEISNRNSNCTKIEIPSKY